jgi:hypothetical protein
MLIHFKEHSVNYIHYIIVYIHSILVYVAETAMGISVQTQRGGQAEYIKAVKRSGEHTLLLSEFCF